MTKKLALMLAVIAFDIARIVAEIKKIRRSYQ